MEKNEKAVYIYCVTRTDKLDAPSIMGIDADTPVCLEHLEHLENFVAVHNRIPLDTFVGASTEENIKDIDWIGPRAMRHEKVIECMMQKSYVYPARFATLFSSMENLRETLKLKSGLISNFLDQTPNKCEYNLRGNGKKQRNNDCTAGPSPPLQFKQTIYFGALMNYGNF